MQMSTSLKGHASGLLGESEDNDIYPRNFPIFVVVTVKQIARKQRRNLFC